MRFFRTFFLAIILGLSACIAGKQCDTSVVPDERWEVLPVSISASSDFDHDFFSGIVEMFNDFSGIDAFQIDDENPQVTVGFGEVGDLYGETITVSSQIDGFIMYGSIEIDVNISDDDLEGVLLHELGHAIGKKTHDNGGLMYCYSIGSDYTDDEWASLFEKLNDWISEIYPEYAI